MLTCPIIFLIYASVWAFYWWPTSLELFGERYPRSGERLAWITSAYGNDSGYNNQIIVLIRSLRANGATEPIYVLDDGHLEAGFKDRVRRAEAEIYSVEPVNVPDKVAESMDEKRFLRNFVRLRMWNMTEFDRLIYVDGDMLVTGHVGPLRRLRCPAASPQRMGTINGGMMVLCPRRKTAEDMMEKLERADERYPMAEQTFVSNFFWGKWHYASTCLNARAYDWRPWIKRILHRHLLFWPPRDICRLEDVVLLHFSSSNKPWTPNPELHYSKEIMEMYNNGRRLYGSE